MENHKKSDVEKSTLLSNNDASLDTDNNVEHKTDPQENMEGPVSSLVQAAKEEMDDSGD